MAHDSHSRTHGLYGGERRHRASLPNIEVVYAWMPPFEGASRTGANRLEVVFSRHDRVALQQDGRTYDVRVAAGGFYVIGEEPTTLLDVPEFSDTLEIYPDRPFLDREAQRLGHGRAVLSATLGSSQSPTFAVDGTMLGLAHILRRAALGLVHLSALEASTIEHMLARHLLAGGETMARDGRLSPARLKRVIDRMDDGLSQSPTLDDLASEACLSPFHFARSFRRTTGLPPHRYALIRRLERAKQELVNTRRSVEDIATSLGFENLHYFRKQFRSQFGVQPGDLRGAIRLSR